MGYFLSLSKPATTTGLKDSEWALLIFGVILVLGVVGELKAPWCSVWVKRFEWIVLIGIAGELIADGGVFLFGFQLQNISDQEVTQAETSARQAYDSARDAHLASTAAQGMAETAIKEAGDISKRAEQLALLLKREQETTAQFQIQAALAQQALQKELDQVNIDVKQRQPRPVLLLAAHVRTDPRLQPFEGQRAYIFDCEGPQPTVTRDEEIVSTVMALGIELLLAKWRARIADKQCPEDLGQARFRSSNITVFTDPAASDRTRSAAKVLILVMHDALLLSPGRGIASGEVPLGSLGQDPDTIVVKVEADPLL